MGTATSKSPFASNLIIACVCSLLGILYSGSALAGPNCNPLNLRALAPGALLGNCGWSTIAPDTGEILGADHIQVRDRSIVMFAGDVNEWKRDYWAWVPIPPQDDVFSVRVTAHVDTRGAQNPPNFAVNIDDSANYLLDDKPAPIWDEVGVMMYLRGTQGLVVGRDGDGQGGGRFKSENDVPYEGNATYTMYAVIDPNAGTYDMTVSVDDAPPVMIADRYRFRRDPTAGVFDSIALWVESVEGSRDAPVKHLVQVTIKEIAVTPWSRRN